MNEKLNFANHSRYFKDCKYIYPVVSRRAEGVSLGINLNINNACNWRCIYCQVEGLVRGKPTQVDLGMLESELDTMLDWIVNGDFIQEFAPSGLQRFNDICIAGNGEPTLSEEFLEVCKIIARLRDKYNINSVKTVLITNGSQIHYQSVQESIKILAKCNGEVWFKVDRAKKESINEVNQINLSMESVENNLKLCSKLCKTLIQSCWFKYDGILPTKNDVDEFISFIIKNINHIYGVLLYSTARNPALPEGAKISQVDEKWMKELQDKLISMGITKVSAYI
ncbi:MAG: hypothetical protein PHC75_09265 [Burkholderiales bacterium]|nr:hypothetical protein [Burkholderiales bacterium]